MMKYVMLLSVATLTAAIFALADVVGVDNTAQAQAGTPSNVSATNGANPGEAVVSWDPAAGASEYRVGWLAVADYQANIDNDRWRERFAYSDVNASSSYTVARLTSGVAYYFITGRKQDGDIVWSAWATLTLNSGALSCPSQPAVAPSTTSVLRVSNGSNPGEVVVSWDAVAGTTGYRVGWLAVPDYQANIDTDRWRERFAYSDINPSSSSYTVPRLTPGIAYYFILGLKNGDNIAWSQWASLALSADALACPFPASAVGGDYDHDNDGLIEVRTLAQLNAIRLNQDGDSFVDTEVLTEYLAAFPGALDGMGCPTDGCKGYELAASLDFDTNGNGEADAGDAYWNDSAGWEPIPSSYYATFDGNGYTIANLYIDRPDAEYPIGLFGVLGRFLKHGAAIRNVVLDGVDVTGDYRVGGLVGLNYGTISGSTVSGTVTGNDRVGGLVGNHNGDISSSTASGTVTGNHYVGGLVGFGWNGDISGSTASGTVSGNDYVGGLVGSGGGSFTRTATGYRGSQNWTGSISGSTASGTVSGNDNVGGLVGWNYQRISDSTASGTVSGNDNVGGLVGRNGGTISNSTASGDISHGGAISDSTASGTVSGNDNIGGLIGWNNGAISNSSASGAVSGNDNVGGLIGWNYGASRIDSAISNSTASGDVSGNDNVGGLVGLNSFGTISESTASGAVSGDGSVGGLVGRNYNVGDISGSTASGTVTGNDRVGGLVGRNYYGGAISNSTAEGDVTGRLFVGGLVGANEGAIEDSTASGNVAGVRNHGALVGVNSGGTITNSTGTGTVSTRQ